MKTSIKMLALFISALLLLWITAGDLLLQWAGIVHGSVLSPRNPDYIRNIYLVTAVLPPTLFWLVVQIKKWSAVECWTHWETYVGFAIAAASGLPTQLVRLALCARPPSLYVTWLVALWIVVAKVAMWVYWWRLMAKTDDSFSG